MPREVKENPIGESIYNRIKDYDISSRKVYFKTITAEHKALYDKDIEDILGRNCKMTEYSELSSYATSSELLPDLVDYAAILYEEAANSGRWVAYNSNHDLFDRITVG